MKKKGGKKQAHQAAPSNQVWEAPPGVYQAMRALIAARHPRLATIDQKIAILFQEKASKSGGQVVLGRVSKASKDLKALGKDFVFIIKIPSDVWLEMEGRGREREALIDHCLCACGVTEAEDGTESYKVLKPDLQLFSANVREYGIALVNPEDDTAELAAASLEEMFGGENEDKSSPPVQVRKKGEEVPDSETPPEAPTDSDLFDEFLE